MKTFWRLALIIILISLCFPVAVNANPGTEDFELFTEVDGGGNPGVLDVTTSKVAATAMRTDNNTYVWKDYSTSGNFTDFTHTFDINLTARDANALPNFYHVITSRQVVQASMLAFR